MKTELRECPFCAGTDLLATDSFQGNPMQYHVYCKSCGTNWVCINKNWNHRPIEDGLQAEIEKLKAVLMDIWHITKEELDEENAILETRGDYMQRLERNINRIETITRKELDKECGQ